MSDADRGIVPPSLRADGEVPLSLKAPHGFALFPARAPAETLERRPIESVPGGRRPTVAVVDTGVADHDWFRSTVADDPILVDATTKGWPGPSPPVTDPAYTWHGTFVAGLVRMKAPDARILSVQLTREAGDTGSVADGQILDALTWLRDRTAPDPSPDFVDVICLAIGYRREPREHYTEEIHQVIRDLCRRGVLMVCAAGNRSEPLHVPDPSEMTETGFPPPDTPVFPAALSVCRDSADGLSIISVGATMADGSHAPFSLDRPWATHRDNGDDVISAVPAVDPWWTTLIARVTDRKPVEDFDRGFGQGSGTSFAAASFAGQLVTVMLDDSASSASSGVADTGRKGALERAKRALQAAGQRA